MKEQFFSAHAVEGGVRVDMSKRLARGWGRSLRLLSKSYARGNPFYALRDPRWVLTQPSLLRHLYPDVAESKRESEAFRRRHRDVLADRALVDRVRARWAQPKPLVLTRDEVDEWIAVLGQLRLFFELLAFGKRAVPWASAFQQLLVMAVDPGTFTGPHNETAAKLVEGFGQESAERAAAAQAAAHEQAAAAEQTVNALGLSVPQRVQPDDLPSLRHTSTDSSGDGWQVVVHNDEVNTFAVVHHVLRLACGHDDAQARTATLEAHRSGQSTMAVGTEADAEAMALRLTRLGLRASFGRAS